MSDRARLFVTSDTHFGHDNIIGYCNRPFDDTAHMDQSLIEAWNREVGPEDIVYHLGDFTLGYITIAIRYFQQLNGLIYVLGDHWHHDKRWLRAIAMDRLFGPSGVQPESASGIPIQILPTSWQVEVDGTLVVLSHYPFAEWDRKHYGSVHFHGHSHGKGAVRPGRLDVGVDNWNYQPMPMTSLVTHIQERMGKEV